MKNINEKNDRTSSYLENEKENLFMKKPRKKFFTNERKRKIKKFIKIFFGAIFTILFLVCVIVIGKSADYHFNTIYDEYEELDGETRYIVETQMKELTCDKNVYVHFLIVYKDIGGYFYEAKIPRGKKYVAIIYNAMDKKFVLHSNIDYLVKNISIEDVEDFKTEIPVFFDMVENSIEENVYLTDLSTITRDIFGNCNKDEVVLIIILVTGCILFVGWMIKYFSL